MPKFQTKLDRLRWHVEAGNYKAALRMAARFPRLGAESTDIRRAWEAMCRPTIYLQMGQNPKELWLKGVRALLQKYRPNPYSVMWTL